MPDDDPRDFIQHDGEGTPIDPAPGRREPIPILRVLVQQVQPIKVDLGAFLGPTAERRANALLLDLASRLEPKTTPLVVDVHTTTVDGYSYHARHFVSSMNPDGTIRARILHNLEHASKNPSLLLHMGLDPKSIQDLMDLVGGNPNVVRCAEALGAHAEEEQARHVLLAARGEGMAEYYADLVLCLKRGLEPQQAVEAARHEAEAPLLPNWSQGFQTPNSEEGEELRGIHGAWLEARAFLEQLEGGRP